MSKFVMAKLKDGSYQKILSDQNIFSVSDVSDVEEYATDRKLDDGQFYVLKEFSKKNYFPKNLPYESTSLESFNKSISDIDCLISVDDNFYMFQNVTKSQVLAKKVISFGDSVSLKENEKQIIIKTEPDAIYDKKTNSPNFDLI